MLQLPPAVHEKLAWVVITIETSPSREEKSVKIVKEGSVADTNVVGERPPTRSRNQKKSTLYLPFTTREMSKRFVKFGLPFLTLVVGGSFGLKYFASLRYEFSKRQAVTEEEAEEYGIKMKREKVSLDGEYKRLQEMNIDTWENIRGPRPWEDSKTVQDEQRNLKQ